MAGTITTLSRRDAALIQQPICGAIQKSYFYPVTFIKDESLVSVQGVDLSLKSNDDADAGENPNIGQDSLPYHVKRNAPMTRRTNIFAAMALLFAFTAPAFAESERMTEGSITVFMKSGATAVMHVTDKAMLAEITQGAMQLDDHAMVVMHDGKLFLVTDHKMSNGKLVSDNIGGGHM